MTGSLHSRLLLRLAERLGGTEELCHRLQVPNADLLRWLGGLAPMPRTIFLSAVDLLVEESGLVPASGTDGADGDASFRARVGAIRDHVDRS